MEAVALAVVSMLGGGFGLKLIDVWLKRQQLAQADSVSVRADLAKRVRELEAKFDAEVERQRQEHREEMAALTAAHKEEIAVLRTELGQWQQRYFTTAGELQTALARLHLYEQGDRRT